MGSCQRISSWLGGSEENEPRFFRLKNLALSSTANQKFRNSTNHQSPRQLKYRHKCCKKQDSILMKNCVFSDAILPFCVPKMKLSTLKTKVDLTSPFMASQLSE